MKITAFDDLYPGQLTTGGTLLVSATGSNAGYNGGDISGEPGDFSVTRLRSVVSLQSNLASGVAIGDTLTIVSTSPVAARFAAPSNTAFGSNSTRVSAAASAGFGSNVSRSDHVHDGIGSVTASSSNTMARGTFNLRPGSNVSFGLSDGDGDGSFDTITISSTGGGGGSGAPTTVPYVVTATDAALASPIIIPGLAGDARVKGGSTGSDEFDTAYSGSITGYTTLGSPTSVDTHTTALSHFVVVHSGTANATQGIYKSAPSMPFTMITCLTDASSSGGTAKAPMMGIGEAGGAGKLEWLRTGYRQAGGGIVWSVSTQATPTSAYTNAVGYTSYGGNMPLWMKILVTSSTSVTYYVSANGIVWTAVSTARNPGFTVGIVVLGMASDTTSGDTAAFDFWRFS